MTRIGQGAASRNAAKLAFGAALAVLLALPAGAAWDGTQGVRVGDTISAEFAGAPGTELHRFSFYVPEETFVTATLKANTGLSARVDLVDAAGNPVDPGVAGKHKRAQRAAALGTLINKAQPGRGRFAFDVTATAGTGTYTLRTKAVYPKLLKGTLTTTSTFQFGAPAGASFTAMAKKAKGSAAVPVITKVTDAYGADLPGIAESTMLRKVPVPQDGVYTLTIRNDGTAGAPIDVSVQLTPPKSGRVWNFGTVEAGRGIVSPQRADWLTSGHADLGAKAFSYWNSSTPAVVPTTCAKCHTGSGFQDFLADGTVNAAVPAPGRSVDCEACHNPATEQLTTVAFPSGKTVTGLGDESRCMTCHQGRESTTSVDAAIAAAIGGVPGSGDDTVFPSGSGAGKLAFKNVHYFAAGATLMGREAQGAYEYPDANEPLGRKPYDARFAHVNSRDTCMECHDQHTLEIRVTACATCHVKGEGAAMAAVASVEDLREVRMAGTTQDYDGDGDAKEGVYYEIEGLEATLFAAVQAYAADPTKANQRILYDASTHPYWFKDVDGDGVKDAEDTAYASWTPRLLRAAYNYQYAKKDPGAFAHNAKYVIAILYDSIADMNAAVPVPGFAALHRNDANHFDQAGLPYRDWDSPTTMVSVPSSCSRCHTAEGFRFAVTNNVRNQQVSAPANDGMVCESCHVDGANFSPLGGNTPARFFVPRVTFPYADLSMSSTSTTVPSTGSQINGVTISNGTDPAVATNRAVKPDDSFLCMTCHQGRQSKLTLDAYVATRSGATLQTMSFQNVHYLPAGGVQYAGKAGVGYAFTGISDSLLAPFNRTYQGVWTHATESAWVPYGGTPPNDAGGMNASGQCTFCHMQEGTHSFAAEAGTSCTQSCHLGAGNDITTWRKGSGMNTDFDGNPATTKLPEEEKAFEAAVLKALNTYAVRKGKTRIAYNPDVNSYFFKDSDGDGVPNGTASGDRYAEFDKFMLFGAHNMHFAHKDPGSWAHNGRYVLQLMYDAADYLDDELWNNSPVDPVTGNPLVRPVTTY